MKERTLLWRIILLYCTNQSVLVVQFLFLSPIRLTKASERGRDYYLLRLFTRTVCRVDVLTFPLLVVHYFSK